MKEVSCRGCQFILKQAEHLGLSIPSLLEGSPHSRDFLEKSGNRVDWDVYVLLVNNASRLVGGGNEGHSGYLQHSRTWGSIGQLRIYHRLAGLLIDSRNLYARGVPFMITSVYGVPRIRFFESDDGRFTLTFEIPEPFMDCAPLYWGFAGYLETVTRMIGLPNARVEFRLEPRKGTYLVAPPADGSVLGWLRSLSRFLRSNVSALRLLQEEKEARDRSYRELERQGKELRGVLEASRDAVSVVRDGRILYANPAMAALLRVPTASALIGTTTDRWLAPAEIERLSGWGQQAEAHARTEARLTLSKFDSVLAEFSPPREIVWADQPARLWQIADVTERRALEQALGEAGFRERQRIAHDLHDGLGQVLTGAAFKARALENLLGRAENEHQGAAGELVALINEATGQARDLAHGLAPVSDTGRTFGATLAHLASTTERLFGLTCAFVREGEEPGLSLQAATQIYRVVQEAITNAIRHGKPGWIEIRLIRTGKQLAVVVSDDGSGLTGSFDQKRDGGMGLRIMRHRMESLGGEIVLVNREGRGAQVILRMLIEEDCKQDGPQGNVVTTPRASRDIGGPCRVVLVDDHPVVRAGLRQMLGQESDLVVCGEASEAGEARRLCARERPDVALVDMLLGENGNSLELIQSLRRTYPKMRIVVLSMYPKEIYDTAAREAGADDYVMKQSPPEVLLRAVRA